MLTKKSIVLNSAGFHLNDKSQVDLYNGPALPIKLLPAPVSDGVKIKPSVLYSNSPSFIFDKIIEHPLKILSISLFI